MRVPSRDFSAAKKEVRQAVEDYLGQAFAHYPATNVREAAQWRSTFLRPCPGSSYPPGTRQRLEKRHHLASPKFLPDNHLLVRINAVNLEHVLREIKTNRGNLHVDGSLM